MKPRLIATDLDGTLFGSSRQVSERTLSALARVQRAGIRLVFATGRMYRATVPYAHACGITTPLVTYQGAWIRDPMTQATWWHRTMARDLALEALSALEDTGLHVNCYVEDEFLIERKTPQAEAYQRISGVAPRQVASFAAAMTHDPTKLVAIGEPEEIAHWLPRLQQRFLGRLYVTESLPTFIEIAHPEVCKSAALRHLTEHWEIDPAEIVAIGDGMNDLDMLRFAGVGIAMGHAPEAVRQAADRVAPPVEEDGLAQILEEILA